MNLLDALAANRRYDPHPPTRLKTIETKIKWTVRSVAINTSTPKTLVNCFLVCLNIKEMKLETMLTKDQHLTMSEIAQLHSSTPREPSGWKRSIQLK